MPKAIITTPNSWPCRLSIQLWRTWGSAAVRSRGRGKDEEDEEEAGATEAGEADEEPAVEVVMAIPIINRG
ncbi:hypothetical protein HFRIS_019243 [Herbaspirillum frisingense GSF30]|uniref:Uncharacterized protein n=1 Tax=Herbaspirillum frisingense GSF30 TaxID=864073 RepID=A0AAI9IBM1_9BURK|nr:hypothetical protein HFRIS_019243 [Herbaspirillum frisingense GSF30]